MLRLQTLGPIGLLGHDGSEARAVLAQPKRIGLLVYLALAEPVGFHRRETLMALFWPELGEEEARRALRQALHFLRQHLGHDTILNRGDDVGLSRDSTWCDVWELNAHLARGEDAEALAYCRGELLAGLHLNGVAPEFEEWLEQRRSTVRRAALVAARRAADRAGQAGNAGQAERWAYLAMEQVEAEDTDLLRLLGILRESGNDTAALAAHASYARRLQERFATEPGPAVRAAIAALRAAQAAPIPDGVQMAAPASAGADTGAPPRAAGGRTPGRRAAWWWTAAGAAAVATFMLVRLLESRKAAPTAREGASPIVAVAVLANRTSDTALDRLGTVAAEWITRGLTRIPGLQVLDLNALYTRGRTASGEPVDPMTLARLSQASYVVGGAYYHHGGSDSLRFAAEVLDGTTGHIVRSIGSINGPVQDPIPAVDALGNHLTSALHSIVDPRAELINAPNQVPPRYDAYLEFAIGQELFWSGRFAAALVHTLRATALDTSFVMAAVYATVIAVSNERCDLVDSITSALEPRVHLVNEFERTTLGMSRARCLRDWPRGIELQQRRRELQPHSVVTRWVSASTYALANRPAEALALHRQIDPGRDLAWLPPRGRVGYYRSLADALHQSGNFVAESEVAAQVTASGANPSLAAFLAARSAVGRGDPAVVTAHLGTLPPIRATGPGASSMPGDERLDVPLTTSAAIRNEVAAELLAHGYPDAAAAVAAVTAAELGQEDAETGGGSNPYELGRALFLAGQFKAAQTVFATLARQKPASIRARGMLGAVAARAGDLGTAESVRRWLMGRTNVMPPGIRGYYLATIAANSGDLDTAMDLIEALPYGAHPTTFNEFHVDPLLAPLHGDARFARFLRPR